MKRLVLAILISATAIMAAGRPPALLAADCLYQRILYYEYNNGPSCGRTDFYCNDVFHYGCQTAYYRVFTGSCLCP
jgi:hypothetical protein